MKATILFRITAVLFVLFAAGHTFGFLTFAPPTQEGMAVRDAMNNVHFEVKGTIYSYGGFYRGFGLSATMSMVFEAFLAWYLGGMARRRAPETRTLGWAFVAWQVAGVVLAKLYFGVPPLILGIALTLLLGVATWLADVSGNAGSTPA